MKTSLRQRDYCRYEWQTKEVVVFLCKSIGVVVFLSYFFYRSLWACLPLAGIGIWYFKQLQQKALEKSKEELILQFKECILSVAASLKAGYAVENAFMESRTDMELLYGKDSLIYRELEQMRRGLVINIALEEQLFSLAKRGAGEEIEQFATVFSIAKRSGGNLAEIIRETAELIGQRLDARQEMQTMLSGRRMEQNVMKVMPFAILGYISISYPGYFDMLYHNWQGVAIMTGCLAIYLMAYVLGEKILQQILDEMA